jgi:hypothetical protein
MSVIFNCTRCRGHVGCTTTGCARVFPINGLQFWVPLGQLTNFFIVTNLELAQLNTNYIIDYVHNICWTNRTHHSLDTPTDRHNLISVWKERYKVKIYWTSLIIELYFNFMLIYSFYSFARLILFDLDKPAWYFKYKYSVCFHYFSFEHNIHLLAHALVLRVYEILSNYKIFK